MKIKLFIVSAFMLVLMSCGGNVPCDKCKGTGKMKAKVESEIPFELIDAEYDKKFKLFSGGYECEVSYEIKNVGQKGGTFEITTFFVYNDIGEKTIIKKLHLEAGEVKVLKFDYKNKTEPDEINHKIISPKIFSTEDVKCDKCGGSGKMEE